MSPKYRQHPLAPQIARSRGLASFIVLLSSLVTAQAVQAGSKESKERAAKTACLSGDAAKGVALLAELYVTTNDLNYLFNQGRCFEQNGRYADAIVRFREYQRKTTDGGHAPDAVADKHIADCQALLDKHSPQPAQAAQPVETVKPAADSRPAAPTAPPQIAPVAPPEIKTATTPQTDLAQAAPVNAAPGSGLRVAGVATLAVGVAAVATGVILNLKANSLASELEADLKANQYSRGKESTRASYETFSWVGYGVGAACVVGGAVLYYLGSRQSDSGQLALVPTMGSGQVGAVLQGAF